jgi:hypothetical protein
MKPRYKALRPRNTDPVPAIVTLGDYRAWAKLLGIPGNAAVAFLDARIQEHGAGARIGASDDVVRPMLMPGLFMRDGEATIVPAPGGFFDVIL